MRRDLLFHTDVKKYVYIFSGLSNKRRLGERQISNPHSPRPKLSLRDTTWLHSGPAEKGKNSLVFEDLFR